MDDSFDVAVIGLGAVGSQAVASLAASGLRVLGIDRFKPPHDRGSSHGKSRLIRFAYFEHPDYVPLVTRAMQLWRRLEEGSGQTLFVRTGLLQTGPSDSLLIAGVLASASRHALRLEHLTSEAAMRRFPFEVPAGWPVLFEPEAGYLIPEECQRAALAMARSSGARLVTDCRVRSIEPTATTMRIETEQGIFAAASIALTVGPWAGEWTALGLSAPRILRKHLFWYPALDRRWTVAGGGTSFLCDTGRAYVYGMPDGDGSGVKVARHDGGHEILPDDPDRTLGRSEEEADTTEFVRTFLKGVGTSVSAHEICRYSMSSDEHFRLGASADGRIVWASGLSGHGFKFATALGEHLAQRIIEGNWGAEVRFLLSDTE